MNLFDHADQYPQSPGCKKTDTSREAAEDIKPKAKYVRDKVLADLRTNGPAITERIAQRIGLPYSTVQPRTSELRAQELIEDTGWREKNASGKKAIVWRAVRQAQAEAA